MFEELQKIIHTLEATRGNDRLLMVFALSTVTLIIVAGVWLFIAWLYRLPELGPFSGVTLFFLGPIGHCAIWYQFVSPAVESAGADTQGVGAVIVWLIWAVYTAVSFVCVFYAVCGVHYKIAQAQQ